MKIYILNEIQDKLIGAIGTPNRDRFEAELQKALQEKAIAQLQQESPMNGKLNATNRIAQQ